jgi:poly-gamma-glutamate synthesis protein (capsule biosynthesis protein)
VGDLLFDSAPGRLIRLKGGRAPFTSVVSRLRAADVTVGNLECSLSTRGTPVPGKAFTFRGDPRAVDGLTWAGFDLLALGNNHARDYGAVALRDTFGHLRRARIAYAGAGATRADAWRPAIIERKGARIAFLSFSQIGPSSFAATSERSGTAYTMDTAKVKQAVRSAARTADYVIVSFHWGVEKSFSPTSRQVRDGRAAIDAGADLVLSHHPHRIQGVEYYRGRLIAYSLGNFVFSPGSEGGRDTMILHVTLGPAGVSRASAEPVHIGSYGKPVMAQGSTATRILGIVRRTSVARGTRVSVGGTTARFLRD